jgi:iron complex transport system permease protein
MSSPSSDWPAPAPDRAGLPRLAWRRFLVAVAVSAVIFAAAALLAPLVGPSHLDLGAALRDPASPAGRLLFVARLPRVLLGLVTGGALAAAGVTLQALLRNPLATPYTLGISSGASLGAVLALFLGLGQSVLGLVAPTFLALVGALATSAVVYLAASKRGRPLNAQTLLLAGVCLSFCLSAAVMLLHYLADLVAGQAILRWLMGGLAVTDSAVALRAGAPAAVGLLLMWLVAPRLNVLAGGDEVARSRGVDVGRTQRLAYVGAALATASVVAYTGPIGFVGLVVPHSLRLFVGPDHRILLPCSALIGGAFLVVCDGAARTILAPAELPVGVLTAMIGGPFLVWLLRSRTL